MKFKKNFKYIIPTLLLIILIGLTQIFNFFKSDIERQVSKLTKVPVKIENISFNPFLMRAIVSNVNIGSDLTLKTLLVNMNVFALINKTISFENISINKVGIEVYKKDDKYLVKGLESLLTEAEKPQKKDEKTESNLKVIIKNLTLIEIKVLLPIKNNLTINKLQLSNLHLSPTKNQNLQIISSLHFNNSEINFDLNTTNYLISPRIKLKTSVKNFDLAWTKHFHPKDTTIYNSGIVSLDSDVDYVKDSFNLSLNAQAERLIISSKGKNRADYFFKTLKISKLLFNQGKTTALSIKAININGLLLGQKFKTIKEKTNWSEFSKIALTDIALKKSPLLDVSVTYNKESKIWVKEKLDGPTKLTTAEVNSFDLTPLSEALYPGLNYHIESGKMDLKYKAKTKNKYVNAETKIVLNHFDLDNRNENGKTKGSKSNLTMPMALKIIKDDAGKIDLEFEFEGKEDDPSIKIYTLLKSGFGGMIVSKFQSIVGTKAANRFLPMLVKNIPFNPMNAYLITKTGYKLLTAPKFENILFDEQSLTLKSNSNKYLSKFTKFVKKNKSMVFKLCPLVTLSEGKIKIPSNKEALKLSASRIDLLKERFRKEKLQKRILFCRPRVVDEKISHGQIDITI